MALEDFFQVEKVRDSVVLQPTRTVWGKKYRDRESRESQCQVFVRLSLIHRPLSCPLSSEGIYLDSSMEKEMSFMLFRTCMLKSHDSTNGPDLRIVIFRPKLSQLDIEHVFTFSLMLGQSLMAG